MKIVLNGLSVVYPVSGVGQYTVQLGKALEVLLGDKNIFWFGRNGSKDKPEDSDPECPSVTQQIQHHLKESLREVPGLKTLFHYWRNNQFKSYVRRFMPSLYHETNYAPFDFEQGPVIITVSDLSFVRHPEWHPRDRVKYLETYCLKRLRDIEAIITISEFSKKEIMNLLGVHPTKIHVTYLGVDRDFTPGERVMKGLPNRYILFLGNLEPRKNLITLLSAYRSLPRPLRERFPLVIAGASGWHTRGLRKALDLFQKGESPILTGYLFQGLLPDLYRGASLFVYPSLYEGFGLPVLEAMASGVPVITSGTTSLPEVVGEASLLVNPEDVDHLREAMVELLEDEKKRRKLTEVGLQRAKLFSWEKCARETLDVYKKVVGLKG